MEQFCILPQFPINHLLGPLPLDIRFEDLYSHGGHIVSLSGSVAGSFTEGHTIKQMQTFLVQISQTLEGQR